MVLRYDGDQFEKTNVVPAANDNVQAIREELVVFDHGLLDQVGKILDQAYSVETRVVGDRFVYTAKFEIMDSSAFFEVLRVIRYNFGFVNERNMPATFAGFHMDKNGAVQKAA